MADLISMLTTPQSDTTDTLIFITDVVTDSVYKYQTNSNFSLTGFSYTGDSFSVTAKELTPTAVWFSTDGVYMYIIGPSSDLLHQYTLSTAWDVTTATFTRTSATLSPLNQYSLSFTPDGTKFHYTSNTTDQIYQYSLSTPWNISSITLDGSYDYSGDGPGVTGRQGHFFGDDGSKMYIIDSNNAIILEYTLSTPYVITSGVTYIRNATLPSITSSGIETGFPSPDGTKMFFTDSGNDQIHEYSLSTAWNVSTLSLVQSVSVASQAAGPYGLYMSSANIAPPAALYSISTTSAGAGGLETTSAVTNSDFGTGDFTYEAWVYPTSLATTWNAVLGHTYAAGGGLLYVKNDGSVDFYENGSKLNTGAGYISTNQWYHIAVSRQSGTLRLFIDGALITSTSYTTSITDTFLYFGQNQNNGEEFNGYIYLPHVIDSAKYTSAFTPSTNYGLIASSLALIEVSATTFTDLAGNALTNNDASIVEASP